MKDLFLTSAIVLAIAVSSSQVEAADKFDIWIDIFKLRAVDSPLSVTKFEEKDDGRSSGQAITATVASGGLSVSIMKMKDQLGWSKSFPRNVAKFQKEWGTTLPDADDFKRHRSNTAPGVSVAFRGNNNTPCRAYRFLMDKTGRDYFTMWISAVACGRSAIREFEAYASRMKISDQDKNRVDFLLDDNSQLAPSKSKNT